MVPEYDLSVQVLFGDWALGDDVAGGITRRHDLFSHDLQNQEHRETEYTVFCGNGSIAATMLIGGQRHHTIVIICGGISSAKEVVRKKLGMMRVRCAAVDTAEAHGPLCRDPG